MEKEEKDILMKDLCARLPYGVVCHTSVGDYKLLGIDIYKNEAHLDSPVYDEGNGYFDLEYGEVKPYLRQMSSMTEEEHNEYQELYDYEEHSYNQWYDFYNEWKGEINDEERLFKITDWLNAHHFDYRGLIGKGLATEPPEGMYDI